MKKNPSHFPPTSNRVKLDSPPNPTPATMLMGNENSGDGVGRAVGGNGMREKGKNKKRTTNWNGKLAGTQRAPVTYEACDHAAPMPMEPWQQAKRILCWWMIQEHRRRRNAADFTAA